MTPQPRRADDMFAISRHELTLLATNGFWDREERIDTLHAVESRPLPHTSSEVSTSKLCFGTQHPYSERCQQCNELETCKQKQRYLDYDKQQHDAAIRNELMSKILTRIIEAEYDKSTMQDFINYLESLSTAQHTGDDAECP